MCQHFRCSVVAFRLIWVTGGTPGLWKPASAVGKFLPWDLAYFGVIVEKPRVTVEK